MKNLDWKWVGLGVLIMVALNIGAAFIIGLVLGPPLRGSNLEDLTFTAGEIVLALVINTLSFLVGGFIVGVKSAGRTVVEPGISAFLAVLLVLVVSRQLTVASLIVGGIVPFVAGVIGGWLGERKQSAGMMNPP